MNGSMSWSRIGWRRPTRRGGSVSRVLASPILINDVLRLPGRLLPAVVCTQPYGDDGGRWLARADVIAERVRGFANVFTLDREAS